MKCANCGAEIKLGCVYCSVSVSYTHLDVYKRQPPTYDYFQQMQNRIIHFIASHSRADEKRLEQLMMNTTMLAKDLGTILVGADAVKEGLIDEVGGIDQALHKLHEIIREQKNECL